MLKNPADLESGASEEILHRSNIETARLLAITVPFYLDNIAIIKQAKQMNPELKIITRAKYSSDVTKLYDAGADIVISEELEGGIEMGRLALKMAAQYWWNQGRREKNRFIALEKAYHGDTTGCMGICDPSEGMHKIFSGIVPRR